MRGRKVHRVVLLLIPYNDVQVRARIRLGNFVVRDFKRAKVVVF